MPPAHFILATIGTDGDVIPFLGLGSILRSRGHRVTLVAPEPYRARATNHGLGFSPLLSDAHYWQILAHPDFWHPIKGPMVAARWGTGHIRRQYELLAELAADGRSVLVASSGVVAARLVQERMARPLATLMLQPGMVPSLIEPPVMPMGLSLPRHAPRVAGQTYFHLLDTVGYLLVGRDLNRVRRHLGLPPVYRFFQWWNSPLLTIAMFPAWFGPPQDDWPPQFRLASFPLYDGTADRALSPELAEFLAAGPPPVAFTFGTGMSGAHRMFRSAAEACRILGMRGILLTRDRRQVPRDLPPGVRYCAFAPFGALFPRCAAAVHHGGIGTMSQALAAGTPQLALPIAYDQFDNAHRVQRLGAGSFLGPRRRGAGQIATAVRHLTSDPGTTAAARHAAQQLRPADGLDTAATWVEQLAGLADESARPA